MILKKIKIEKSSSLILTIKKKRDFIREIWFSQMRTKERHIFFFDWFDRYYINGFEEASPRIQETMIKRMTES